MKKVIKKTVAKKPMMKVGGAKKTLKKYQGNKGGSSVKTPFQEYMTTPGAVASDTVMSRKPFTPTTFDRSTLEKPKAKNPQNTKALINAAEKTYGMDVWDRPWTTGTKNKYLTPAEEKEFRRMGPLKKKGGSISKPKMAKGGATKFGMLSVKAGIDKNPKPTAADRIAGAKMNKKKMGGVTKSKKK